MISRLNDQMYIAPAYRQLLRRCDLHRVAKVLAYQAGEVFAWSRTTETLYVPDAHGGVGFFLKRYRYPTWRSRMRALFRGTLFGLHRGKAEFRSLVMMRRAGASAIGPVAYGARRIGGVVTTSFLITEAVPDAVNLTTFAQEVTDRRRSIDARTRHAIARRLATTVKLLHAGSLAHGRLFWRNILIALPFTELPEFYLLDADPPHRMLRIGRGGTWWVPELARLATSAMPFTTRTDRIRFLKRYVGGMRRDRSWRMIVPEIDQLTGTWEAHERYRIEMNRRFDAWRAALRSEAQLSAGRRSLESASL